MFELKVSLFESLDGVGFSTLMMLKSVGFSLGTSGICVPMRPGK